MPTKVQITGVGIVELDDNFTKLAPEQQQATIEEIASHATGQGAGHYSGPPVPSEEDFKPDAPKPPTQPQIRTNADGSTDEQGPDGQWVVKTGPAADDPGLVHRTMAAANSVIPEILGAPGDLINFGLRKLGITDSNPMGGSKTAAHLLNKLGWAAEEDDPRFAPRSKVEQYLQGGAKGVASTALPLMGMLGKGAQLATAATKVAPAAEASTSLSSVTGNSLRKLAQQAAANPGLAVKAEALGGLGSGVGAQAGSDLTGGNPYGELAGSLLGGMAGGLAGGVPHLAEQKFIGKQVAKNPYAAYDAEIATDLARLPRDTAVSPLDPKGRAAVTAKSVNNLEQGYQSRFKDMLNALDIPQAEKLKLKAALDQDYTGSMEDVQALRGTPQGDAVADAIIKTQRLRALTPELRGSVLGRVTSKLAPLASTALGSAFGGPGGAVVGGMAGNILRRVGDGEAARVNAAERLMKRAPLYEKVAAETGPSGAIQSKQKLIDTYNQRVNAKDEAKASKAAKATQDADAAKATDKLGAQAFSENVLPGGGFHRETYDRHGLMPEQQLAGLNKMVADGKITQDLADKYVKSPRKLKASGAGYKIQDYLAKMAEDGTIDRDPKWTPPAPAAEAPTATAAPQGDSKFIANPISYAASAKARQARVTQTLGAIQGDAQIPDGVRQLGAEAVAKIGSTSDKAMADDLVSKALQSVPAEHKDWLARLLSPLAQQIN